MSILISIKRILELGFMLHLKSQGIDYKLHN